MILDTMVTFQMQNQRHDTEGRTNNLDFIEIKNILCERQC